MLFPFKCGLGGIIGSGKQYMSWIALDEVLGIINHIIHVENLQGPLNVVSPHLVTNRTFTKILGKILARPTFLPMPAWLARIIFGEAADELLLSNLQVSPQKLINSGYQFCMPDLEKTLRGFLKSPIE